MRGRNYYEVGGGDECATPCDYCGAPVVGVTFSGSGHPGSSGTDFFDSDNNFICDDEDPEGTGYILYHDVKGWMG